MKTTMILSAIAAICTSVLFGCGLQTQGEGTVFSTEVSVDDSGTVVPDSGTDSAPPAPDSGTVVPDSGTGIDSGTVVPDSGTDSAPPVDSGIPRADSGTDSGVTVDSGTVVPDSGTVVADSGAATDSGVTPTLPDPFKSPAPCTFDVSSHYVSGASSGELRGDLPDMTWTSGMKVVDSDDSGYMGLKFESVMPVGTYGFSYIGYQGSTMIEAWAQYGLSSDIAQMSLAGRSYLFCNWWDAATSSMLDVAQPNCMIQVTIDEVCHIIPAGNMANFAAK